MGAGPRDTLRKMLGTRLYPLTTAAFRRARSSVASTHPPGGGPGALPLASAVLFCTAPLAWYALQHGPHVPAAAAAPPWGDAALAALGLPAPLLAAVACGDQGGARRAFTGWSSALLAALGALHAGALLAAPGRLPLQGLRVGAAAATLLAGGASAAAPPAAGAAREGALARHHALMLAHLALHGVEEALARARPAPFPGWYLHARAPATACIVVAHAVAAYLAGDPSVADSTQWEEMRGGARTV